MRIRALVCALMGGSLLALSGVGVGSCASETPLEAPDAGEPIGKVEQAATGVCDSTAVAPQACIDAIQKNGGVINDIFKDVNGKTGPELPTFGKLFNNWPNCTTANTACNCGISQPPYDCAGQYSCESKPKLFTNVQNCVNALDRLWGHPYRLIDHTMNGDCPNWGANVTNGVTGHYFPWEGLVFDLGGPSNKVVIFAENDNGPQPCESLEYTVYLTDEPLSKERITDPIVEGVDPSKWNRAVLSKIFTKGWIEMRPPDPVGHAGCGDTKDYSVEEDSFVQVFSLPCGITFRYAAIISGNDGLDFPECAFDSSESELDAVAGLTESGAGVCPDADGDHYVDCNCPGAPQPCDCNDADPGINPAAPEPCDSEDVNCDGQPGSCTDPLVCYDSICLDTCVDENASCPKGSTCKNTEKGMLCVPDDCSVGGCPPGSVCNEDGQCVPACKDVVCPGQQICQDGQCIDPCKGVQCPSPLVCKDGTCVAPCECYKDDIGCKDLVGMVCDKGNTGLCVDPPCKGVVCAAGKFCDGQTGMCLDFCHPGVKCPVGQKCIDPLGCVPLCSDVTCPTGYECNPENGQCEDHRCDGVTCFDGKVCFEGACVESDGGAPEGGGGSGGSNTGGSGGATGDAGPAAKPNVDTDSSCGCRLPGADESPRTAWLLLGFGLFAAALSRRRRR